MKTLDAAAVSYLGGRGDVVARYLVWFQARNRSTGAEEASGLWTGIDATTFTVDGENRTYFGAGSILGIDALEAGVGLDVRMLTIQLTDLAPEVAQLVRGYDARLAPVAIHLVLLNHDTRQLIAPPMRRFRGWVDLEEVKDGEDDSQVTLTMASDARRLTRPAPLYRSDAAMRQRASTDRFREYTDIGGRIPIWWGREREDMRT